MKLLARAYAAFTFQLMASGSIDNLLELNEAQSNQEQNNNRRYEIADFIRECLSIIQNACIQDININSATLANKAIDKLCQYEPFAALIHNTGNSLLPCIHDPNKALILPQLGQASINLNETDKFILRIYVLNFFILEFAKKITKFTVVTDVENTQMVTTTEETTSAPWMFNALRHRTKTGDNDEENKGQPLDKMDNRNLIAIESTLISRLAILNTELCKGYDSQTQAEDEKRCISIPASVVLSITIFYVITLILRDLPQYRAQSNQAIANVFQMLSLFFLMLALDHWVDYVSSPTTPQPLLIEETSNIALTQTYAGLITSFNLYLDAYTNSYKNALSKTEIVSQLLGETKPDGTTISVNQKIVALNNNVVDIILDYAALPKPKK